MWRRTVPFRPGILNDVLTVIAQGKVGYVKALLAKEPSVRPRAEIRAVLVIDVPECALGKHAFDIGGFEEDPGILSVSDQGADRADEIGYRSDVFERVTAKDNFGIETAVFFGKKVGDELDLVASYRAALIHSIAGIDA